LSLELKVVLDILKLSNAKKMLFFRYTLNYVFGGYFLHQLTTSSRAGGFQNLGPSKRGVKQPNKMFAMNPRNVTLPLSQRLGISADCRFLSRANFEYGSNLYLLCSQNIT
jgi:hypothetical protein